MGRRLTLLAICALVLATLSASEAGGFDEARLGWARARARSSSGGCDGSIGECFVGEELQMMLDTESNRRILATSNYISYGALQRNTVPCSRRGASYYNCQTGASSNPYSRGCSTITRCRS